MATQTKTSNTKPKSNTPPKSNTKPKSNTIAKRASATRGPNPVMLKPVAEFNEHTAQRVQVLSKEAVDNGKKAGAAYLSSYEKAVLTSADAYEQAANSTKSDLVASIAKAQADFTRATTKAYSRAARKLVS